MLKIIDAVRTIVSEDEVAYEALRLGFLNLSAYAVKILPRVETLTWKSVKKPTVVVALSRLAAELQAAPGLLCPLKLDDLNVKSPLTVYSYEKTMANITHLRQLYKQLNNTPNQFVAATQGSREITLIVPAEFQDQVATFFPDKPKAVFSAAVGISVSFSDQYLPVPNVIYTILSALAVHRVNVIEVVSTYTELSVIIAQADLELATRALRKFLR